jgi:hypothetical protein
MQSGALGPLLFRAGGYCDFPGTNKPPHPISTAYILVQANSCSPPSKNPKSVNTQQLSKM